MKINRYKKHGARGTSSVTFDSFFGRVHLVRLTETEQGEHPEAERYYDPKHDTFYASLKVAARNYGVPA